MCVKKFNEFVRENYSNYKENLSKYLKTLTIEKEGYTDDEGVFTLQKEDGHQYDVEKLIKDKLSEKRAQFVGVFSYSNINGETDEDLGFIIIYYDEDMKEYKNIKMDWDEFSEYFIE